MQVPFLDLPRQHARIRDELDRALGSVVESAAFVGGPRVASFQEALAEFVGTRHAVGVASGTSALAITLRALGLEPGDEVITTALTAAPTAEAVTLAGARVVFADIDENTFQIDPQSVAEQVTSRTRALLPVHLYGLAAPLDALEPIAREHDLVLIEDTAQALGARFRGARLGSIGRAGCLSFFPSKNLGGFGDGGAVVTDDPEIHRFVTMYSNHGRLTKFDHEIEGANERLDGLQAAVLEVKLRHLDAWNARRREVAGWYAEDLLEVEEVTLPSPLEDVEPSWHLYVIRISDRDALQRHLKSRGIQTGQHYPLPLHLQRAYGWMQLGRGTFPAAELATSRILSLPMDPFLTREQVRYVTDSIKDFAAGRES
ncbi:MAG: DegT/DnrJ/EryC1/StrS family aminotransferase [Myxococcota bacterium]